MSLGLGAAVVEHNSAMERVDQSKQELRVTPAKRGPFQGAHKRARSFEQNDSCGSPSELDDESPEGLDDPVGFQRQFFQQQLSGLGRRDRMIGREINTTGSHRTTTGTRKQFPHAEARGETIIPPLETEGSNDLMEEDAVWTDRQLSAPGLHFTKEQSQHQATQQVVVLVPYPMERLDQVQYEHVSSHMVVRPCLRL